jgi:hypothetical protein
MAEEMIPSPAEKPDEKAHKKRAAKSQERPNGDQQPERPKAAHRRTRQLPDVVELVDQLRQVMGLLALGLLAPANANPIIRCLSKSIDTVMRCQTSSQGVPNLPELMEACRQNPKLIPLVQGLLTDDQLAELLRQITDDET